jgi:hypothetical protein
VKGYLQLEFPVLGKDWTLRVLSEKYFKKKNGDGAAAVTKVHKRRIELRPKFLDSETIIHELTHSYLYELCIHSTNEMTLNDMEEIFAELMAKRGRELLDRAEWISNEIANTLQNPK